MNNTIDIMESVYKKNEELASKLNSKFTQNGIFAVNVMGAPGVGKTSSLIHLIKRLSIPAFVIEGDIESDIDTKKLTDLGISTVQINTGGACHLDSPHIKSIYETIHFNNGIIFIENIGNLVCPAEFMIGEHIKLLISSVTEGSDKPYKYPLAFEKADIIILNKCDLIDHTDFDLDYFINGVRKLNPTVPVIQASAKTQVGFDEAVSWLIKKYKNVLNK